MTSIQAIYRAHHLEGRDEASLAELRLRCAAVLLEMVARRRGPFFGPGGRSRQILPLPFLGVTMTGAVLLFGYAAASQLTVTSALPGTLSAVARTRAATGVTSRNRCRGAARRDTSSASG